MKAKSRALLAGSTLALAAATPANLTAAQAPAPVAQHTEAATLVAPPAPKQFTLKLAAGATLNAGNTEAYAGNVGGTLGLIRFPHQLSVDALGTMGYSKANPKADVEQTSANVIGRARYDLFLSRMDALFVAMAPRRDTFAGLNLRLQNQVGYLRNLYFPADSHRLWTEVGYDLTYDVFARTTTTTVTDITDQVNEGLDEDNDYDGVVTQTTTSTDKQDSEVIHSARLFFGYTNLIHPAANLNLGAETLFDFEDGKNVRVNGLAEITSSVTGAFKLGIQSRLFFDNVPVAGKDKTDVVIAVQLIYTFDSLAGQAAAPAPCDCTAAVNEAHAACALEAAENVPTVIEPGPSSVPIEPPPAAEPTPSAPVTDAAPTTPVTAPAPAPASPN